MCKRILGKTGKHNIFKNNPGIIIPEFNSAPGMTEMDSSENSIAMHPEDKTTHTPRTADDSHFTRIFGNNSQRLTQIKTVNRINTIIHFQHITIQRQIINILKTIANTIIMCNHPDRATTIITDIDIQCLLNRIDPVRNRQG